MSAHSMPLTTETKSMCPGPGSPIHDGTTSWKTSETSANPDANRYARRRTNAIGRSRARTHSVDENCVLIQFINVLVVVGAA